MTKRQRVPEQRNLMTTKSFILITAALLVIGMTVGIITIVSRSQGQPIVSETAPATDQLHWHAQKAKAEGQQEVLVPGPIVEYDGSASSITTEEMLSHYALVRAKAIEQHSYAHDSNLIVTWYKFKVSETLSEPNLVACPNCPDPQLPQELLPVQSDEFLFCKSGGSLVIDGVRVTMLEEGFPPFKTNQDYLLFIFRRLSGNADIAGGPIGAFTLDSDGRIAPHSQTPHPVKERLSRDLGNSVNEIKQNIRAGFFLRPA